MRLFAFAQFGIRPLLEEAIVTLAMLHVDRARTRMPLVCTAISMLVLAVVSSLGFASWIMETNNSAPDLQGANAAHVPQIGISADASDARESDSYETESWVRHSREF